ncbi:LysM peptidoglycan-binding domain-containing protein [Motilimonas sp. 1_MG-2023]|uniref:LysM peptidoglycan-binding domain-containing protein n=1 Tax=Motilimonas sp. 1_MG-2023 TaxID=3062672 RepID=UPI0026E25022|nr:LysM peptidoglycan-binding domain-containing protein [Motilimonas sp. 1_MG-2023]MDO6528106.1 LysM peptidoglycan-binding domain-containing protein [Motilimonas sp. 1_MG-2023]
MNDTYLIQEGDTLSVLAQKFNTSTSALQNLNSEQIKNIHLIIENNTLVVPQQLDNSNIDHPPVTHTDTKLLSQTQCTQVEYTEVMYFPEHHETKKPTWLALTKEAVNLILQEDAQCRSKIVKGDKEATLTGLTELGIMDQFNSLYHEFFLPKKDKPLYQKALLDLFSVNKALDENVIWVPQDYQIAREEFQSLKTKFKLEECTSIGTFSIPRCPSEEEYNSRIIKTRIYRKAFRQHQINVRDKIQQRVKDYETSAKKRASKTIFKENGVSLKFAFYPKGEFYTSDTDLKRYQALRDLIRHRKKLMPNELDSKNSITSATKIIDIGEIFELYEDIENDYKAFKHFSGEEWILRMRLQQDQRRTGSQLRFFTTLYSLNQFGVILKEQALSKDELFKHHKTVDKIDFTKLDDKTHYNAIMAIQYEEIGYYCARKVYLATLKEAAARIGDFSALVGTAINNKTSYVSTLLNTSLRAYARITALKALAEQNVVQKNLHLHFQPSAPLAHSESDVPISLPLEQNQLVWDELDWQPTNKAQHFFADPGINNTRIVEGYLSGNNGKVSYCRNTLNAISTTAKNCGHAQVITPFTPNVKKMEDVKIGGLTLKETSAEIELLNKKFAEHSAALSNKYQFYWRHDTRDSTLLPPMALEVGGQAQFFRFSTGQEIGNNASTSLQHLQLGNHKLSANFDVFRGALGGQLTYPDAPDGGKLEIPYYIDREGKVEMDQFDIGHYKLQLAFNVGGALGVSVALGTEIQIGPVESAAGQRGLGIRGTVPNTTDLPAYRQTSSHGPLPVYQANPDGSRSQTYALGGSAEAKAFAGIQCGGSVNFDFQWRPPVTRSHSNNQQGFRSLVAASAGGEAKAGIGGSYKLQIAYHDGKFIMLTSLSGTLGLGFGGSVGLEISPLVLDDIIYQLLLITKQQGFRKIAFCSTDDAQGIESDTFNAINKVLTIMLTYQLKASQIMLLPFRMLDDLSADAKMEKNAPYIARYFTSQKVSILREAQKWIEPMYPETLAAILKVLTYRHDSNYFGGPSNEDQAKNALQREAIINILKWLSVDSSDPSENDKRQFEETMQRITLAPNETMDKAKQWDYYVKGLVQLREFFVKEPSSRNQYIELIELFYLLGANIYVYQFDQPSTITRGATQIDYDKATLRAYKGADHKNTPEFNQLKHARRVPWTIGKAV